MSTRVALEGLTFAPQLAVRQIPADTWEWDDFRQPLRVSERISLQEADLATSQLLVLRRGLQLAWACARLQGRHAGIVGQARR